MKIKLFILLFLFVDAVSKQAIIFDLGGVLLREAEANLHKAAGRAPKSENLQKILNGKRPKIRIFNKAFEFASLFCGNDCRNKWILGTLSGLEIVLQIKENIDKQEHNSFFKDQYERDLIKHGIEFVLLPDLLAELTEVIVEGYEFATKCKNNGIELAIISNWDPASFEIMKFRIPEFFKLFEEKNIVIPSMLGKAKPSREIYDFTIKRLAIDPELCFFVDDNAPNVKAAQEYGIKSVLHKDWKETEQKLIELGLHL